MSGEDADLCNPGESKIHVVKMIFEIFECVVGRDMPAPTDFKRIELTPESVEAGRVTGKPVSHGV